MERRALLRIIIFLSVMGMLVSGYLAKVHYSENRSFCDFNERFSCSEVNRGEHAELLGFPVALIGLLGYSFLGLIGIGLYKNWEEKLKNTFLIRKMISAGSLFSFSLAALLISLYLTYTELLVIGIVCLMCVVSQITILGITWFSYKNIK